MSDLFAHLDETALTIENGQIFLSYARKDTRLAPDYKTPKTPNAVDALFDKLRRMGFAMWRDVHEITGSDKWWRQIVENIAASDAMVVCLSPHWLASDVAREERRIARQQGKPVLLVLIEDLPTSPKWVMSEHYYDLRASNPDAPAQWQTFIAQLARYQRLPKVPVAPLPPDSFVARPAQTQALLERLLDPQGGKRVALGTALQGGGGFGKTTLAKDVCRQEAVKEAFDDGTLWVEFGETPNVLGLMAGALRALGDEGNYSTLEDAKKAWQATLEDRHLLVVLDDVWNASDARAFLPERTPKLVAAFLMTTRSSEVAVSATGSTPIIVDEMTTEEATALLSKGLEPTRGEREKLAKLAGRLREWALLIEMIRAELVQLVKGDGKSILDALAHVERRLERRGLSYFNRADENERNRALNISLEVSLERLGNLRERYLELGIFPEDTDVPLATVE